MKLAILLVFQGFSNFLNIFGVLEIFECFCCVSVITVNNIEMGSIFSSYEDVKKEEEESRQRKRKSQEEKVEKGGDGERLNAGEVDKLAWSSHFSCADVKRLYQTFDRLAKQSKDPEAIQRDQFEEVLKSHGIPFSSESHASRLFAYFDKSRDGKLNFKEFVLGMSVLAAGSPTEKFKLSFEIYDADNTGDISKDNLIQVLTSLSRGTSIESGSKGVSKDYIENLANKVIADADKTKNGTLTYAEYFRAVMKYPWLVDANIPGPESS